jgi:aspartate aminotransferase
MSRIGVSTTMRVAAEAELLRRAGEDVVDLAPGEPDFPTPDNVKRAAVRAIEENFTRYTAASGTPELKEAICARHAADFGARYSPAECIVSVGAKHVVFNAIQALVDAGDEVIIPVPYWVTFCEVVRWVGGKCVFIPTEERSGFQLTASMLEPRLSARTKLVILNSPANPSGAVIEREEFERILELVARRGICLLADECYCHFVYDSAPYSISSAPGAHDTVIVAGSLSKTYSMTGWRIGFGLGPEAVIQACVKLQMHTTSNPNSVAQKAAVEALRGPQDSVAAMLEEYRRRRAFVMERLRQIPGVSCAEPKGAFYAFPHIGGVLGRDGIEDSVEFCARLLERQRVAMVPGEAFGAVGHVRLSYATSMHELERGLDRLHQFVAGLRR